MTEDHPNDRLAAQIRELEERIVDLEADAANDMGYMRSARAGNRQLRALFAEFGVDPQLHWPDWVAAIRALLEGKRS